MQDWIYYFGTDYSNSVAGFSKTTVNNNIEILGRKGLSLLEMSNMGLAVPPGFIISSKLCKYFYKNDGVLPSSFKNNIRSAIKDLEIFTNKRFGGPSKPLLISVRSSASISMPGMLDTVLNLGINTNILDLLIQNASNTSFVFDVYKRFMSGYGSIVLGIQNSLFKEAEEKANTLPELVNAFQDIMNNLKLKIPISPYEQLESAIEAVIKSWMSNRAISYRKLNNISEDIGTAIIVQSMVFGNNDSNSATGVVFTRSPTTGENRMFGEFLINAQGEDVVSGIKTPLPICCESNATNTMQNLMPNIFYELQEICKKLELYYKDIQDIEFTIERGKLYILQTRSAKRTVNSAIKIAIDMTAEKLISKDEAIKSIELEGLNQLFHSTLNMEKKLEIVAKGLPASPGAVVGLIAFSIDEIKRVPSGKKVILVCDELSPEDVHGMYLSDGIITSKGGMTSHAAVIARAIGKPCICGVKGLIVDVKNKFFKLQDKDIMVKNDHIVSIDGSTGEIFLGEVSLNKPKISSEFKVLSLWSSKVRAIQIMANAETVKDIKTALNFKAQGVGLCRTEHMFFNYKHSLLVQELIITLDLVSRYEVINKLIMLQIQDFKEIFRILRGLPINIRLLDPPLHEFLPRSNSSYKRLAKDLNLPLAVIKQRVRSLQEINPMLGHRGCRLGISNPEIYEMQISAIIQAIYELNIQENIETKLELMLPLIGDVNEFKKIKSRLQLIILNFEEKNSFKIQYSMGSMIELPRAALLAGDIASEVDYFSFGTNDLTQTTYGVSRDDVYRFLPSYLEQNIWHFDPFTRIDENGVGELMKLAIKRGKAVNDKLRFGVCGEHASDPKSIEFFTDLGIDYISCTPYKIPIANIAAAQAKIKVG